jgi:predicted regulator of Ras-like GTPase activity (Roadblock/LC7/MglB family)
MPLAVQANDLEKIRRALSDLLLRSESDECFLCDGGGYLVAHEGVERADATLISALGAGVFMASRELARMLGEQEFNTVFHQGDNKNIFIRAVTADVLLVVIFSSGGSLGLVKLYSAPAVTELQGVFETIRQRHVEVPSADHRAFVLRDADIFTSKQPAAAGR